MKILLVSPLEMPYTKDARYTGLERLVVEFATELVKEHEVTVLCHKDTWLPDDAEMMPCAGYVNNDRTIHAEQTAFQQWQHKFYDFDVIWDISHLHLIARYMSNMPTANVFHPAPVYYKYQKAPYNLVSWSKWGVQAIWTVYKQKSVYQETIAIDPEVYKPVGKRGDRLLTIGRMHPEKGNLNAVMLCRELGLPLDVVGGRGSEATENKPLTDYEQGILDLCDGKLISFIGEATDDEKIKLMQSCRALLYYTDHIEITSHKVQEALLCGSPVIIPRLGGLPEIITDGVDGYACNEHEEYVEAVKNIDNLQPELTRPSVVKKYCRENVVRDYVKLFKEVANGKRWK